MKIDAIIFDSDGTLFPTLPRQEAWLKHWVQKNGYEWPFNDFRSFMKYYNETIATEGVQGVYDGLAGKPGELCDMNDRNHKVWAAYEDYIAENPVRPYPGIIKTVKTLWRMGQLTSDPTNNKRMRLGINTTNSWKNVYNDLSSSGLTPYFDCFVTKDTLDRYQGNGDGEAIKKPSPIGLALIMEMLDVPIGGTVIHIGDTGDDLKASHGILRKNSTRPESLITILACYGYEGPSLMLKEFDTPVGKKGFDYGVEEATGIIKIVEKLMQL